MEQFDPYYKWLGIGPNERPINYYRLLGLRLFEADADVISHAADRQIVHIRSFQTGKHSAESQKLLNELSAAQRCLLNAQQKAAYDVSLRRQLATPVPPAVAPPAVRQPPPPPPPAPAAPARPDAPARAELDMSAILGSGARDALLELVQRTPGTKPAASAVGPVAGQTKAGLPPWLLASSVAVGVVVIGVVAYLVFGRHTTPTQLIPQQPPTPPVVTPATHGTVLALQLPDFGAPVEIRLDDKRLDVSPGESQEISLTPGDHRLELRRPGFQPLSQTITLVNDDRKPLDLAKLNWTPISTLIVPIQPDQPQSLGVLIDGFKAADLSAAAFRRDAHAFYLGVEAGRHEVALVDRSGSAHTLAHVFWAAPDGEATFDAPWLPPGMPADGRGLIADYYRGRNFDRLLVRRYDRNIDNFWGMDQPLPDVPAMQFSVRWTGYVKPPKAGHYTFLVVYDDGARLYFDGQNVPAIDAWQFGPPRTKRFAVDLDDQPHPICLEYFQSDNEAACSFRWVLPGTNFDQPVPPGALFCDLEQAKRASVVLPLVLPPISNASVARGLKAEFYRDQEFKDKVVERVDRRIDWPWAFRPPAAPDIVNNKGFSVRWSGWVKAPRPGMYRWLFTADGTLKVFLDDNPRPVIEGATTLCSQRFTAQVMLDDKPHRLRVEYINRPSAALITWRWIEPGASVEKIVSAEVLWANQPADAGTPTP